ncbi:MAG: protein-export chaperone SecB [Desulfoprunum sp.]|jgi:preprotein translocase subunit SecB|uniref:protein-export chaperone SecB n=1 Tax=Desulfoprunum sp. TaxID=2020866 RepID=UPI00052C413E|nr:preprotein translocase subunit SecB [Desulfobulbus sp. Tol-SR]
MAENNGSPDARPRPEFRMQKMYIKDLSFENPFAPQVFITPQKAEPKVELNLNMNSRKIDEDHWEVSLQITAKVISRDDEKAMFVLEIEHAAVFLLKNIPEEHLEMVLKVDCPTLLFPFTRQIVSQVSIDGGFTPFLMEPINFMGLFQSAKKKRESEM